MRSSTLFWRAGLALLSVTHHCIAPVSAQTAWTPEANCNANGNNGGRYTDTFLDSEYDVTCGQNFNTLEYDDEGTRSQGIYACFRGCNERPACVGFVFVGTVSGTSKYFATKLLDKELTLHFLSRRDWCG